MPNRDGTGPMGDGVRDAEWVPVQKVDSSVVAADSVVDFVDAGRETLLPCGLSVFQRKSGSGKARIGSSTKLDK
jgi:hypothetical protein